MKTLYQTLENRDNPDHVEDNGPFKCKWPNSWLGDGYYFWDTFRENAHWWGFMRYKNNYIIGSLECDFSNINCFDLVGNTEQMLDFDNSIKFLMNNKYLQINENTTVSKILNLFRIHISTFSFEAIRVFGIFTISENKDQYKKFLHRITFEEEKKQYLDYKPAIQICFFEKDVLQNKFQIIYPEEFVQDYVV